MKLTCPYCNHPNFPNDGVESLPCINCGKRFFYEEIHEYITYRDCVANGEEHDLVRRPIIGGHDGTYVTMITCTKCDYMNAETSPQDS